MTKVFVYGSLLSGLGNHPLIESSHFLGKAISPKEFSMIDLGWFPGIIPAIEGNAVEIVGEVYEVDDSTLQRLDRLEGYRPERPTSGLYNKTTIETEFGPAVAYVYNFGGKDISPERLVKSGDWKTHLQNKNFK